MSRNSTSSTPVNIHLTQEEEVTQSLTMSDLVDVGTAQATQVTDMLTAHDLLEVRDADPGSRKRADNDAFAALSDPDAPPTATEPLKMDDLLEVRRQHIASSTQQYSPPDDSQPTTPHRSPPLQVPVSDPVLPRARREFDDRMPRLRVNPSPPDPAIDRPVPSPPPAASLTGPAAPTLEVPKLRYTEPARSTPPTGGWRGVTTWLLLVLVITMGGAWLRLDPRATERLESARTELLRLRDQGRQSAPMRQVRAQLRHWRATVAQHPAYERAQPWLAKVWPEEWSRPAASAPGVAVARTTVGSAGTGRTNPAGPMSTPQPPQSLQDAERLWEAAASLPGPGAVITPVAADVPLPMSSLDATQSEFDPELPLRWSTAATCLPRLDIPPRP